MDTCQQMRLWSTDEGKFCIFNGLTTTLINTALDEVMEVALSACIETCAMGSQLELSDKLILKATALSVTSIFTAPVSYLGLIQRCQSDQTAGLLTPRPVFDILSCLPWRSSFYQLVLFSGLLALNVRLIQFKIEQQREDEDERLQ